MAKAKVFPTAPANDKQDPHQKFSDFATRIIRVPKAAIDERDERWQKERSLRKG
jgi:hypothetical protein